MPKRTDIKSILIIGAGPIIIGQACEFDYSGTQACKALKDEGYRIILVNSNPATIMTDPDLADATYMEPITPDVVAKIIEKERPDALLPTMGGQTALNCALSLRKMGVLEKFGVEILAALPFDAAMSQKLAPDFVLDVLVNGLRAVHVVAGYDFRYGKGRGGDAAALSYMGEMEGFGVSIVEEVRSRDGGTGGGEDGGKIYSSSRVRDLLAAGDPRGAARLLGHWWTVETHVRPGDRRGRTIGFPTANLSLEDHVEPALGVYAVRVEIEEGPHKGVYDGVANVGRRPTFDKQDVLLEVHIFDFGGDIYGQHAAVSFIDYLRPERKFDGLDALKAQIALDSARAREILAAMPRGAQPEIDPALRFQPAS